MTPEALKSLCPTASWSLDGEDIVWEKDPFTNKIQPKNLIWYSEDIPMPTKDQIDQEILKLKKQWQDTEYQRKRIFEYPNLSEFVDAYYWERRGDSSKMEDYLKKVDQIKAKYPSSGKT